MEKKRRGGHEREGERSKEQQEGRTEAESWSLSEVVRDQDRRVVARDSHVVGPACRGWVQQTSTKSDLAFVSLGSL